LWLATLERAKVKDLHLHDLRREHATQMAEAGASVTDIRDQLGHSNITMTNTYLGRSRDRLAKAQQERTAMRKRQALRLAQVGKSGATRRS
jgi:integrase